MFLSSWVTKDIISKLDKLNRSFLWKKNDKNGMHLLNWGKIIYPMKASGIAPKDLDSS